MTAAERANGRQSARLGAICLASLLGLALLTAPTAVGQTPTPPDKPAPQPLPKKPEPPPAPPGKAERQKAHEKTREIAEDYKAAWKTLKEAQCAGDKQAEAKAAVTFKGIAERLWYAIGEEAATDRDYVELRRDFELKYDARSKLEKSETVGESEVQRANKAVSEANRASTAAFYEAEDEIRRFLKTIGVDFDPPKPACPEPRAQMPPPSVATPPEKEKPKPIPSPSPAIKSIVDDLFPPTPQPAPKPIVPSDTHSRAPGAQTPSGGCVDVAVLTQINAARTDPAAYAATLRSGPRTPAANEAVAFLQRQAPLQPLAVSPMLDAAAARHAADQGPGGLTGHTGTDGSSARDRVQSAGVFSSIVAEDISLGQASAGGVVRQLIIDETSPARMHRSDLFNPLIAFAGVGGGPHKVYRWMCVIDLSGPIMSR